MPISYPLDTTGTASSNLVSSEIHTLTEINDFTHRIIIPSFAPFYLDNLVVEHISSTNVVTALEEDVDFVTVLIYESASRSIGKMLYGGLSINTELLNGTIRITYQTLGGDWTADPQYVLERIAESNYNPRITIWDIVTDKPNQFPPTNHDNTIDTTYGYKELLDKFDELVTTIANNPNSSSALLSHITAIGNVHGVTKDMVGLGFVENYPVASDLEVTNKDLVDKYVTLRQLISLDLFGSATILAALTAHTSATGNVHNLTKAQINLDQVVNYPIATPTQITNLELANAYVTLAQVIPLIQRLVNDAVAKNTISPETLYMSSNT